MKKVFNVKHFRVFISLFMFFFVLSSINAQDFKYEVISKKMPFYIINADYQYVNKIIPVKLGFEYKAVDASYEVVYISPQGWLSFVPSDSVHISDLLRVNNLISPFLLDKNTEVAYEIVSKDNEKMLIVQWLVRKSIVSQVIIRQSGEIEFHYTNISDKEVFNLQAGIITNNEIYGSFDDNFTQKKIEIDFNTQNNYYFTPNIILNSCKNGQKAVLASDYSFSSSTTTYTTVSGTNLNTIEADEKIQTTSIGFTFNYCGTDYTDVLVSSNGWLSFNTSLSSAQLVTDLDATTYSAQDLLAPLWDDLDGTGHGARCNVTGTSPNRIFEVEWRNWEWNYNADEKVISFKVRLFENDDHIEFVYRRESGSVNSPSTSIGIQDANGNFLSLDGTGSSPSVSSVTETSTLSTRPATGQVYSFTPPSPCVRPTNQPTALNLTVTGAYQIDGSFTAATSSPDGYLIVRSTNSSLSADPVDGTTYADGDALGGGTVIQMSSSTTFNNTCLVENTQYYYYIFSYNSACSGGPLYLSSSSSPSANPLTGNATTGNATADKTLPYSQNFDADDGWTYGAGGIWARGNQTDDAHGPPSGHSGNTVAGTNLNADYANNVDDYLVTPSFDLSSTTSPVITFWMDMESQAYWDGGTVQIEVNECSWITIDKNDAGYSGLVPNDTDVDGLQAGEDGWSGDQPSGEWSEVKIDLFALTTTGLDNLTSNDIIKVRFWFGSSNSTVDAGWYIDDFSIYQPPPCSEPTAQATNLSLTPGYTVIDGTFTEASPSADKYLVVISTDATLSSGDLPVDGIDYSAGDVIGDGTVVQSSNSTSFTASGLTMGTQYYFFVFSFNNTACIGANYLTTNPLTGNATTYDCSSGIVPYQENFDAVTTPALPPCWVVDDVNSDGDTWETSTSNPNSSPNCLRIEYNYSNVMDDWAFAPGLNLQAGHTYIVEFMYRSYSSSSNESLEVKWGDNNTVAGMNGGTLFTEANMLNTTYQLGIGSFSPSSNGLYYIGFHGYSPKDHWYIYVDDIFIYEQLPPVITSLSSNYLYKDKGKRITITGSNLTSPTSVDIGGVVGTVISSSYSTAVVEFPAGTYPNGTLTYTTAVGSTTTTVEIRVRNIIPVDETASADGDIHQTIASALNGLYAWYGNTAFNAGDLAGEKIIEVSSGTYAEMVVPNTNLNPVSGAGLILEVKEGHQVVVNASSLNYGFDVNLDYTTIKGFKVQNANNDNIRSQGNNCVISYNECFKGQLAGIRAYNNTIISHNLVHENLSYGIYLENATNAQVSQNTTYQNGGLPGAAGYTREVWQSGDPGNIYNWEFSSTWQDIAFVDDDEKCLDFNPITGSNNGYPFQFDFWGTHYGSVSTDSIGISSNGVFLLDGDIYGPGHGIDYSLDFVNQPMTTIAQNGYEDVTRGNDNMLACFWDDIYDDAHGGEVSYAVRTATSPYKKFIVVWNDRVHYSSSNNGVSVEMKIYENTNVIEFHYKDLIFSASPDSAWDYAASATIGIKKDEDNFDEYSFDTAIPHGMQGGAIRYTPNPTAGTELYISSGSSIIVENNIMQSLLETGSSTFYVIQAPSGVITTFNYNDVYKNANVNLVKIGGTDYADLSSWGIGGSGNIETDPKFVDVDNYDFHIKSSATGASFHNGEWPPFTAGAGTWTADNDISPDVDAGDPAKPFALEQPDNGSRMNIGVYGNTLQATKTTVLNGIWTGAVDTVWNVPNNWSDAVVPTGSCVSASGTDATIPDVSSESGNFPYISNIAEVEDLTIETGASVTILPNAGLTVCGTLTNNEGVEGVQIISDATGDGSLIHSNVGVSSTINRYLRGTQYHYISSPIDNANTTTIGIQGGTSGVQLYGWDASMQWNGMGASPPSTIDYAPWNPSNPVSGSLDIGKGYAYYYSSGTLVYSGNINVGDYTVTMHKNSGGDANDQGWNFLGNPYAAAIDWDNVAKPATSDMESAIYLFNDDAGTGVQANYSYYVPSGGTGGTYGVGTSNATKNIPVGQGFFVKALNDNVDITIDAGSRVHSSQSFYKNDVYPNFIRASIVAENEMSDEMVVRFIEPATLNFDAQYDARKLITNNSAIPQLFSILDDGTISAINSMPDLEQSYDLKLGFVGNQGNYIVRFNEFTVTGVITYLEDTYTDTYTKIYKNTKYQFSHTGGYNTDRFVLHFVKNTAPFVLDVISDKIVYENSSQSFVVTNNAFDDYDFGDNLTITASYKNGMLPNWLTFNANTYTFNVNNAPVGDYRIKLTATDNNGEFAEQYFYLYVIKTPTSIDGSSVNNKFIIYPNPTNGEFTLFSQSENIVNVEVIDATGKIIKIKENSSNSCSFDLAGYSAGLYTLKIRTSEDTYIEKIIFK